MKNVMNILHTTKKSLSTLAAGSSRFAARSVRQGHAVALHSISRSKQDARFRQQLVYGSLLFVAVLFWLTLVLSTAHERLIARAVVSPALTTCGITVDGHEYNSSTNRNEPQETYDPATGTYSVTFTIKNNSDKEKTILWKGQECRCPEGDGHTWSSTGSQRVCIGDWPNAGFTGNNRFCKDGDHVLTLGPREEKDITLTSDTPSSIPVRNCGSFQVDFELEQVLTEGEAMCNPDRDVFASYGVGGLWMTGIDSDGKDCKVTEDKPPLCDIETTPNPARGTAPLTVTFDGTGSSDPDGTIEAYEWTLDGAVVSSATSFTRTFSTAGSHEAKLRVQDNDGNWSAYCPAPIDVTTPEYICSTRTKSCEPKSTVPVGERGNVCEGTHDDDACRVDRYICDTSTRSCEPEASVPTDRRGATCAGLSDDAACKPVVDYVCDTSTRACADASTVPGGYKGNDCSAIGDDAVCQPTTYVCDTRSQSCEIGANVPAQYRGTSCAGLADDIACRPSEFVCDTRTKSCEDKNSVPAGSRGGSCTGMQDDDACNYVCDTRTRACEVAKNVPAGSRGVTCTGAHDDERCRPTDTYVCDTQTKSCEALSGVPVDRRGGSCASLTDDAACATPKGPKLAHEPWVMHVSGTKKTFRKTVYLVSGGPASDWSVSGATIVSESSDRVVLEASWNSCPTVSVVVGGKTYGPYALGCVKG